MPRGIFFRSNLLPKTQCFECQKTFKYRNYLRNNLKQYRHFCSRECYYLFKRKPENRIIAKNQNLGAKNPFWRGGITKKRFLLRNSLEYKLWREAVFKRDKWTCMWCGMKSGNGKTVKLNADHIKPFCDYPALRFALDNGRTLCVDCHKKTDSYGAKYYQNYYVKKLK